MPAKSWTTEDQVEFLKTFEEKYLKAAQSKKIATFFEGFFPLWFNKYPEEDALGDATDLEDVLLSKASWKQIEKEEKATSAHKTIIDAQVDLLVRT